MSDEKQPTEQPAKPQADAALAPSPALNRRTVLATAAAAGLGVAAARLMSLANAPEFTPVPVTGGLANKMGLDWASPLAQDSAKVAHLLRRTTFGATEAELAQAQSDGYAKTVDRLLETKPADPPVFPGGDEASSDKALNVGQLQQWWIDQMLNTATPFAERMTLFWHGHFTSDFRKVTAQTPFIYWQNLTWRKNALADLRTMLYDVTVDPGMLRYLDLGNSTGKSPNENYSRELMELFAMGPEAFTEDDVKAAAKGLAGWREPTTQAIIDANVKRQMERTGQAPKVIPKPDPVKTGIFDKARAYSGPAFAYLGETRVWNTDGVIDKILTQDATAPFIVHKLLTHFVTPTPADATVLRLATSYRKTKYDTKSLMRDIFMSPEFAATASYRSLIKTPTEFMVNTVKALGDKTISRIVTQSGPGMGQALFDPPSVGGWPENESWVSSNSMLARANFVTSALQALKKVPSAGTAHQTHLDGVISSQTLKLLNEATDDKKRWSIVFASPEFQLK